MGSYRPKCHFYTLADKKYIFYKISNDGTTRYKTQIRYKCVTMRCKVGSHHSLLSLFQRIKRLIGKASIITSSSPFFYSASRIEKYPSVRKKNRDEIEKKNRKDLPPPFILITPPPRFLFASATRNITRAKKVQTIEVLTLETQYRDRDKFFRVVDACEGGGRIFFQKIVRPLVKIST